MNDPAMVTLPDPQTGVTDDGSMVSVLPGTYEIVDFVADERGASLVLVVGKTWIAIDVKTTVEPNDPFELEEPPLVSVSCPQCGSGPGRQEPIYNTDNDSPVVTGGFRCTVCRTVY